MTKRSACSGKKRYNTLQEARVGAAKLAADRAAQGDPVLTYLRAYKCQHCGGYHFGSCRRIDWEAFDKLKR